MNTVTQYNGRIPRIPSNLGNTKSSEKEIIFRWGKLERRQVDFFFNWCFSRQKTWRTVTTTKDRTV